MSIVRNRGDLSGGHKECPVLSSNRDIFEFLLSLCQCVGAGWEGVSRSGDRPFVLDGLSFFGGKLAFGGYFVTLQLLVVQCTCLVASFFDK